MHLATLVAAVVFTTSTLTTFAPAQEELPRHAGTNLVNETAAQHDARMLWFREAKFGMFIHWGAYSTAAAEWNGKPVPGAGEWLLSNAQITPEAYEPLRDQFNPVKFDATRWVQIAKDTGMKYIVITSKHHDGFGLWDSPISDWDVGASPFAPRDPLKELADACAAGGIRLCFYHSIMDWHHPDYLPRRSWDKRPTEGANYDRYEQYMKAQLKELVSGKYGKIGILWFDGEWEGTWTHEKGMELYDYVRGLDADIIVNNRVDTGRSGMDGITREGNYRGDYGTPEQQIPAAGLPNGVDWETCMTMNGTWGFDKNDHDWKSKSELIHKLCDIASKGGNFLLNIGPTGEGEIPAPSVERLAAMGAWMKVNSSAIYNTHANPFSETPAWGRVTRGTNAQGGDRLYLMVFDWPKDGTLQLSGLLSGVGTVQILGQKTKQLFTHVQEAGVTTFKLPTTPLHPICTVVSVDLEGTLAVASPPVISAADEKFVGALEVSIANASSSDQLIYRYTTDGSEPTQASAVAAQPFSIHATTTVRARGFYQDNPATRVESKTFELLTPLPAVQALKSDAGLAYTTYAVAESIKNCSHIRKGNKESEGVAATPSVDVKPREEFFGLTFTGFIDVPEDGLYRFFVDSDDGSTFKVQGSLVVNNDELHSAAEKSGAIALAKGLHPIELDMFEGAGQDLLRVSWITPTATKKVVVPASAWKH
ncbi:MAG: hypothetical protein EXS10_09670 [Phycisphaerales bacterium]|nr:hypothetical protein [Phycisphaerales bacterium]